MSMHGRCSAMQAMQALRAMRQGQTLRVSGRCGQFVGARLVIHCPATGAMMSMDGRCPAMRCNGGKDGAMRAMHIDMGPREHNPI